jgi:hypothetical protein
MIIVESLGKKKPMRKPSKEKMEAPKKGKNPRKNYFGEGGQRM